MRREGRCGREGSAGSVDAAAWMDRGTAQVQATHEGARAAQADRRPEDQLLLQLHGSAAERTEPERLVPGLEEARTLQVAIDDQVDEARREALDGTLHPAGQLLRGGVVGDPARQVRIRP